MHAEYGKWSGVHKRFIRWTKAGIWQMIFNTLAVDEDTEWLMIDSTMIRAHQHGAGARKNLETGNQEQELGRSRGGFSKKLHTACDGLGNPTPSYMDPTVLQDKKKIEAVREVAVIYPAFNEKKSSGLGVFFRLCQL